MERCVCGSGDHLQGAKRVVLHVAACLIIKRVRNRVAAGRVCRADQATRGQNAMRCDNLRYHDALDAKCRANLRSCSAANFVTQCLRPPGLAAARPRDDAGVKGHVKPLFSFIYFLRGLMKIKIRGYIV